MYWLDSMLATYPLLITNMNVDNFTSLDDKASLQPNNKEAGRNARSRNTLVGPPGFEPRTQGL